MLKEIFDPGGCVGCPPEMGCLGKRYCPQCNYTMTLCDICKRETDGEDICEDCRRMEENEDETE